MPCRRIGHERASDDSKAIRQFLEMKGTKSAKGVLRLPMEHYRANGRDDALTQKKTWGFLDSPHVCDAMLDAHAFGACLERRIRESAVLRHRLR